MKQFVKKKVSFVMVMIMAVITVISMSLPMAVFAQGGVYANAENEGSTPHTFQIYQIFSGDLDESKTFLIFSGERELKKLQKKLWELRLKSDKLKPANQKQKNSQRRSKSI